MSERYEPGMRVSEYVLEERLGMGTFGEVWRARHHVWQGEEVAVKLPTEPDYVRYLKREGLVTHGLRHPNIVSVKGLDPYADVPYLVMELVRGPSLRDVLDQHPNGIPIDTAVRILRGVLEAMEVAHAAGVLHRDLKPGNVLLNLDDRRLEEASESDVRVSDFGLGSGTTDVLKSIAQSASMERDNQLVGTLAYMAPELREGKSEADPRSDLYALGVMLFELLTGERPAGAELPSTLRSDVPRALDDIFQKLYVRAERRYESAAAVLEDLNRASAPPMVNPPPAGAGRAGNGPVVGRCAACQNPYEAGDQFCTHCGNQLVARVRRCAHCGAYPGSQDRFCIFCGSTLEHARA